MTKMDIQSPKLSNHPNRLTFLLLYLILNYLNHENHVPQIILEK
jgi:hypothetical protein